MKSRLLLSITFIFISFFNLYAQPEFWGVTRRGGDGTAEAGVIYKTDGNAENLSIEFEFDHYFVGVQKPSSTKFLLASNGKYYGTVEEGGENKNGAIIEFDLATKRCIPVHYFDSSFGEHKYSLLETKNGKLYGVVGISEYDTSVERVESVIYEYDIHTSEFTIKYSFDSGTIPSGSLIKSTYGILYGTTSYTDDHKGTLYEFNVRTSSFSIQYEFISSPEKHVNPIGHLVEGEANVVYGTSINTEGSSLYSYDLNDNTFNLLFKFNSNNNPIGSLAAAANGNLYGVYSNQIFEYNFASKKTKLMDAYTPSHSGGFASKTLQLGSDGKLYGMSHIGVIYSYDTNAESVTVELETQRYAETILLDTGDGKFLAMSKDNGISNFDINEGTIFEFDSTKKTFNDLFRFGYENSKGGGVSGSLTDGGNGHIYGLAYRAGVPSILDGGKIFDYDISTGYFNTLHFFYNGSGEGYFTEGALLLADNNKLYGFTLFTMFEYDLNNNVYTQLLDFNKLGGSVITTNTLIQASNGKLYGLLKGGGVNSDPILFEYDITSNTYTKKYDLGDLSFTPVLLGSLVEATNGKLYAITNGNSGRILEYDISTEEMNVIFSFYRKGMGTKPSSSLLLANNGKLYGTNITGGANNDGTIFELDTNDNTVKVVYNFNFKDNTFHFSPVGDLLQASNGKLYGKNVWGGANEKGSIYEYDLINDTFVNKVDFSDDFGPNARNFGHLIEVNPNQLGNDYTIKEDEKTIIVYPNPSTGIVNINIANFNTPTIKIYNVSGQLIYNDDYVTGLTYSLELKDKPGIYFVEVSSISKKQVIKLIKK